MNRREFAASALGALALAPRRGHASGTSYVLDKPGKWREMGEDDDAYARDFAPDLTERRKFMENLSTLLGPIKKHPAYANPMGFEVRAYRGIRGDYRDKPPHPIPGHVSVDTFFYYRPGEHNIGLKEIEISGESPCTLALWANSIRLFMGDTVVTDETEALCLAPDKLETKISVPHWSSGWALTKRTAPLWIPATQERFLKAWIYVTNKDVRGGKPSSYQKKELDGYEAALAKLSDAEKKAPTWVAASGDNHKLSSEGATGAKAVVIPNPSFFDPALPRTALQLLHVGRLLSGGPSRDEAPIKDLRSLIYKKFDYPALRELLA